VVLPFGHDVGELTNDFFPIAEHHDIDEVGDGFGVVGAVPANHDQGVATGSVGGMQWQTGKVDAVH